MPAYLKNLFLVFGGVAVMGGGIFFIDKIQNSGAPNLSGTASIFNSINSSATIVEPSGNSSSEISPVANNENVNNASDNLRQNIVSNDSANGTVPNLVASSLDSILPVAKNEFISFTNPIGPMGGGGGLNLASVSPVQPDKAESASNSSSQSVSSTVAQDATSTPSTSTSTDLISTTTIAVEVFSTSTTSSVSSSTIFIPLSLCILEPVATSSLIKPADHLLISKVLVDNEGADTNEFVEIFNPTDAPVSLTGWSLQYLSGGATSFSSITKKNFFYDTAVIGRASFLVGMGNFADSSDMRWSQALNNSGATIFLVHGQTLIGGVSDVRIVDRVAYGAGAGLKPEGEPAGLPPIGQILARKNLNNGVCVLPDGPTGEIASDCDTGNNLFDFVFRLPVVSSPPVLSAQ
jgi:hypothetical protein